jgi:hypothetical protein
VDGCKPMLMGVVEAGGVRSLYAGLGPAMMGIVPYGGKGLTLAHFRAQLEVLRDTSLTLELNLRSFGTHPRFNLDYMGDKASLS